MANDAYDEFKKIVLNVCHELNVSDEDLYKIFCELTHTGINAKAAAFAMSKAINKSNKSVEQTGTTDEPKTNL